MIRIASVNIGSAQAIPAKSGRSGIFKTPQSGPVKVTAQGLEGDVIVDRAHHGGPAQAVYAYTLSDAFWWMEDLGRDIPPGLFGENLTLDGIASSDFALGDRLVIGDVVLSVTAPRIPCITLESRLGLPGFAARFRQAARSGPYFRVLEDGEIRAGQTAELRAFDGPRIAIDRLVQPGWATRLTGAEREVLPKTDPHPGLLEVLG